MSRCPSCGKVLPDEWIRSEGAALLGRKGGQNKARTNAREAARARWRESRAKKKRLKND
jgi:hypothetical protein